MDRAERGGKVGVEMSLWYCVTCQTLRSWSQTMTCPKCGATVGMATVGQATPPAQRKEIRDGEGQPRD